MEPKLCSNKSGSCHLAKFYMVCLIFLYGKAIEKQAKSEDFCFFLDITEVHRMKGERDAELDHALTV